MSNQLEAWTAMQEVVEWENLRGGFQSIIDRERKSISVYEGFIETAKGSIGSISPVIGEINSNVRKVQQRLAEGDRSVVKESRETRHEASMGLGKILASNFRAPECLAEFRKAGSTTTGARASQIKAGIKQFEREPSSSQPV